MWFGFLVDFDYLDLSRVCHFPLAIRVRVDPNILGYSFISTSIISCIGQVKNKRFLTSITAERACVEWKSGKIVSTIPIQEGSCWHLHISGRENAPKYLNRIAPRSRYGPNPIFIIANGLLHKPIRVEVHWAFESL